MINIFTGPTKRVKRIVKKVYEDQFFIYNLSWIDDEKTMKELPEYGNHVIEDIILPNKPKHTKNLKRYSEIERDRTITKYAKGRKVLPKTEYLPIETKRGRPNIDARIERSHFFPNFQAFKSIISNETNKTSRLVILKSIKTPSGFIKFTCKEISSFFLGSDYLETLKKQSWIIIKEMQLIYFNWDLNIDEKYVLPFHFVDRNYYSEEGIALRKAKAEKTKQMIRDLQEMIRIASEEETSFINSFNELVQHEYSRNAQTDLKVKQRFFRKLKTEGRADIFKLETSDIDQFVKDWKKAYHDVKQKKKEFINLMNTYREKDRNIHISVLEKLFTFPVTIKDVIKGDLYSSEEFDSLINEYKSTFEKIEMRKFKTTIKKERLDFQRFIDKFDEINPEVNEKVKKKVLTKEGKSVSTLNIGDIKLLTSYWKRLFDKQERAEESAKVVS